jgi:hypothetical protein
LKYLWFRASRVLEFDISSILRFKNLKGIRLEKFTIKKFQFAPFCKLSDLDFKEIEIDANSLDLIFIHSRFKELWLKDITINGILKFNNSFQNLSRAVICRLNSSINFNRIFKAIGGSANTLTDLNVRFQTHEDIESNIEILKRLTKLKSLTSETYPEVT